MTFVIFTDKVMTLNMKKNFSPSLEKSDKGKNVYVVRVNTAVKAVITKSGSKKYPWSWIVVHAPAPVRSGTSMTRDEAYDSVRQLLRRELA